MADRTIRILIDADQAIRGGNGLRSVLGSLNTLAGTLGVSTVALTAAITRQADRWARLTTQLRTVTDSQRELEEVQRELVELAIRTNSTLDGTVNLYARLARATENTAITQSELLGVTEAVNQAFVLSGATSTEAENAIIQLSQGLAAGVFRGEEFNSVAEQGPRLLRALTDALGVTQGELRSLAEEGRLTTNIVVQALTEQTDTIAREFAGVEPTVGAALTRIQTRFTQTAGEIDDTLEAVFGQGLTETVAGALDTIESALDNFNDLLVRFRAESVSEGIVDAATEIAETEAAIASLREMIEREPDSDFAQDFLLPGLDPLIERLTEAQAEFSRLQDIQDRIVGLSSRDSSRDQETGTGTGTGQGADAVEAIIPGGARAQLEAATRAQEQVLTESQARIRQNRIDARERSLADLREGRQDELAELQRTLALEEAVRDGAITQEQAQLENRIQARLQAAVDRSEREAELQRQLNAARFEAEQSQLEEQFLESLNQESLNAEQRQALIDQRDTDRVAQRQEFDAQQRDLLVSTLEEENAIRESFASERERIERAADQAILLNRLQAGSQIVSSIQQIGANSIRVQRATALAQAGISIATGIARAQELGFPANLAEAARVAAVGVNAVRQIRSARPGSTGGGGASGGGASAVATPSQTQQPPEQQRQAGIENNRLSELREELANRDPNEVLSVDYTRRIVDSVIEGQVDGSIEAF